MLAFPLNMIFLCKDDAPGSGFPQAAGNQRLRICAPKSKC
jgi:hypothetical protein